jgi:hypothetical protein
MYSTAKPRAARYAFVSRPPLKPETGTPVASDTTFFGG